MKFIQNKKGFTLVELVVGTAILAVIGLTTTMLMTSGTNSFRFVHRRSTVLFKSQVAATQLQQAIVDCEYPFAVFEDTLLVGDKEEVEVEDEEGHITKEVKKVIHVYRFSEDDGVVLLRTDIVNDDGYTEGEEEVPFCFNVVSIDYEPEVSPEDNSAYALKFNLEIEKSGLNYKRNEVLSLRNHPVLISGDSVDEIEQKLAERMGALT